MTRHVVEKRAEKQRFDPFVIVDIVLNLWLASRFFQLWAMPGVGDVEQINYMAILIAFEFIMVHSGCFMAVVPFKYSILIFFPVYGLFAWVFNSFVPDNSILYLYLAVVAIRMRFAFFNTSESAKLQVIGQSVFAVFVYFLLLMAVGSFSSLVPQWGLTPEFLERAGYKPSIGGSLTEQPETAMCLGFMYYLLLSLFYIGILHSGLKRLFKRDDTSTS